LELLSFEVKKIRAILKKRIEKRAVKTSNWLAEDINRLEGNPWVRRFSTLLATYSAIWDFLRMKPQYFKCVRTSWLISGNSLKAGNSSRLKQRKSSA